MAEKYTKGFYINDEEIGISEALSATYDSSGNNIAETFASLSGAVSANPEGETEYKLTSIKIDDTIYSVECSGSDATFPEEFTTNVTVGGVDSGTKIEAGESIATVVKNMLLKYIKPTISLTLSPATTLYYYGQSVSTESLTASVTQNSGKITKVTFKRGTTELDSTESETGVSTATYSDTTAITDTVTYYAIGEGTDDISSSKTITFCNPSFIGTVAATVETPTADDITGLQNKFANNKKGYTYTGITMDYGKVLYAYPKSFGALTTISDGVNSYFDSYTQSEISININGTDVVYYAYILKLATGVTNWKQVYG